MATQHDELCAHIRELESSLPDAAPEMRAILEQQITTMRHLLGPLEQAMRAQREIAQRRPQLSPEVAAFFAPSAPASIPTWIPDGLVRAEVHESVMRCPPGSRVYAFDSHVGCAIPGQAGSLLTIRHGLQLAFYSTGRLQSQSWYEHALSRWSISYHATGARERVGFYVDREPLVYLEHGEHTRFSPNGTVVTQVPYVGGVCHGWAKFWEDDGYPIGATLYVEGRVVEQVLPDGSRRQA